jgi:serine/threonine-protein kinase BUR1
MFMVTPYMDHDLAGLLENPMVRLKVPHVKSYMKQLLQGTAYLHDVSYPLVIVDFLDEDFAS